MKTTKKFIAMAMCGVMTAVSMASVNAFAATNENTGISAAAEQNNITVADSVKADDVFNGLHKGYYYAVNGGFIAITGTSASNASCTFNKVAVLTDSYDHNVNQYIYGVPYSWAANIHSGSNTPAFTALFYSQDWYYYNSSGNIVYGNYPIMVEGTYDSSTGTITLYNIQYTS